MTTRLLSAIIILALLLPVMAVRVEAQTPPPVGEIISSQGIAQVVSANAFLLLNPTRLNVAPANVLVFPDTAGGFAIDINNGIEVEVVGELITFDIDVLEARLGYELNELALANYGLGDYALLAVAVTDITETAVLDDEAIIDIEDDPTLFLGEPVTVEGFADVASPNVFRLLDTEPVSLAPANLLVLPDSPEGFAIDISHGMRVQVTGTLHTFDPPTLESALDYDLNNAALTAYDINDYAIIATSVIELDYRVIYDESMLIDLEADTAVYVEEMVTASGVAAILSSHAFELVEPAPFDLAPGRIVVVPDTGAGFRIDINNGLDVTITGMLVEFDVLELEARLGYDLNNRALAEYGPGDYAVIASSVVRSD